MGLILLLILLVCSRINSNSTIFSLPTHNKNKMLDLFLESVSKRLESNCHIPRKEFLTSLKIFDSTYFRFDNCIYKQNFETWAHFYRQLSRTL